MPLRIKSVELHNFRSYESFKLEDLGMLTVFVGPNAVGKTNIVEGIQLLTALTSFRSATIEQLVKQGCSAARINSHVSDGNRELDLSLHLEGHSKKYRLNGKPKKSVDLRGLVPSVTFTPDDLNLVKGSMSARRQALDTLGSQLNANYHLIRKDYEKVIRHKNKLLKDEASAVLIDSIDEMLITCGAQLICYRTALFERLLPHMKSHYEDIAGEGEEFSASYEYSWESRGADVALTRDGAREALQRALEELKSQERARKRCLVGPHLDKVTFFINGMDASAYASQGQQRTIVLAERLAEAAVIEEMLGQKPVLLLDDVMSELDGARREALVTYISQDVQTFITTANLAYFDQGMLDRADVVHLNRGEASAVEFVRVGSGANDRHDEDGDLEGECDEEIRQ